MISIVLTTNPHIYNSLKNSESNIGLGNVLYQTSTIYSICKKYDISYNFFYLNEYNNQLKRFGYNHYQKIFRNIFSFFQEEKHNIELQEKHFCVYDETLINDIINNKDKNILIKNSYLQSHHYFHDYEEDIQRLFEPDEEFLNTVHNKYPKLFDESNSNIAIQMRLKWGDICLDPNFIVTCLKYFEDNQLLKKNVNLWIFSDNIDKAKELLSIIKNYNIIFVSDLYEYEDLWMMSLISNHIVCFSTFSWWGAYLNKNKNKIVLYSRDYYDTFYRNILRRDLSYETVMDNFYPKEWIRIDSNYIQL
jgi:hypothetical protein